MTKELKMLDKVKKLLALANNNSSIEEAQSAMLKAQQIMAEYNIKESDLNGTQEIKYSFLKATHANNEGFRVPLSNIIARNFKCKNVIVGQDVYFYGREEDAQVCVEIFNYAYRFAKNRGISLRNKYREEGRPHKGVANSYFIGFMNGLQTQLDSQCKALAIIVPQDVKDTFVERFTNTSRYKHSMAKQQCHNEVYTQGKQDGQAFFNRKALI